MAEELTNRCMRCKEKKEMVNVKEVKTKNNLRMAKGECKECGCKMCKILGKWVD
jgi:hypothetical protein